jgi:hypothetical protein
MQQKYPSGMMANKCILRLRETKKIHHQLSYSQRNAKGNSSG